MTATVAPGPYEAKVPRNDPPRGGYRTAEQELADALEGTAPHLTNVVAGLIGPQRTAELAKAIARATDLAVRRHAFDHLEQALVIVEQGLDGIPAECGTPESVAPWEPHEPAPEPPPAPEPKPKQVVLCGVDVGRWLCPHFKPCPNHGGDRG